MRHLSLWLAIMMTVAGGCSSLQTLDLGEALLNEGDYASAEASFTRTIEAGGLSDQELQRAHLLRGEARLELGRATQALDDIDSAIAIFPSAKGFYLRGRANKRAGDFFEAAIDFRRVIEIYQREGRWLRMQRGGAVERPGLWDRPATTGLAGKSSLSLGEIALYEERYLAAMAHLDMAARLAPTDREVFLMRSGAFQLVEQGDLAAREFQRFLDLGGDPAAKSESVMGPLQLKGCLAQYAADHYPAAVDRATAALALHPKYTGALMCRGHSYAKLGNHAAAVEDFTSVTFEEAGNLDARIYRAFSLTELGKYGAAEEDASFVLGHDPANLHALLHRGFARLGKRAYAEASADFSRILEIDPDHERARLYRGIARYQAGNLEGARADFQAVIDRSPAHGRARQLLALTHYRAGDHKAALAVLTKTVELDQEGGGSYHMRGLIHFREGRKKAALADFEKAVAREPENGRFYLSRGAAKSSLGRSAAADYALARKFFTQQRNHAADAEEILEPKMEPLQPVAVE